MKETNQKRISLKFIPAFILIIALNVFLIVMALKIENQNHRLFIIVFSIILTLLAVFYLRGFFIKKDIAKKSLNNIKEISIDNIEIIIPISEELNLTNLNNPTLEHDSTSHNHEKTVKVPAQNKEYDKKIDMNAYIKSLQVYLSDHGVFINEDKLKVLFSSMAASRVIIIQNDKTVSSQYFIELLSEFIGANNILVKTSSQIRVFDDIFKTDESITFLKNARENEQIMQFLMFEANSLSYSSSYLEKIFKYSSNQDANIMVKNQSFTEPGYLSKNLWFIFSENSDILSDEIRMKSFIIDLELKLVPSKDEVIENDIKLAASTFRKQIEKSLISSFMDESIFKRIDQLNLFMKNSLSIHIDNIAMRQIEKYGAYLTRLDNNHTHIIDSILINKIVPLLKNDMSIDELKLFITAIEDIFKDDMLSHTMALLKELEEKSIKRIEA